MGKLIEDLLLFSAPRPVDNEELDVTGAVAETVSLAQHGLGSRQVAVSAASRVVAARASSASAMRFSGS